MLDVLPYDVLESITRHMGEVEMLVLASVSSRLRGLIPTILFGKATNTNTGNNISSGTVDRLNNTATNFDPHYDIVHSAVKREAVIKKNNLIRSYHPTLPNFFSRETGAESLASYDPCVLWSTPMTQYLRMEIDYIICNIAVTAACRGVQLVVDTVRVFQYTQDILDLYPRDHEDGFINLGCVFDEFPIKAGAIYLLFEFCTTLTREQCLQHVRLDIIHPPYPFLSMYHMIDIPLQVIRHAYVRPPALFDTDYGHVSGIIFHNTNKAVKPWLFIVENVSVLPDTLPRWMDLPYVYLLRFNAAKAAPLQINVFPKSSQTSIFYLTSNILSYLMHWQLQCA